METNESSKPKLCIYNGYAPHILIDEQNCYGSEIMALNLSEKLSEYYEVHVFGTAILFEEKKNDVTYHSSDDLYDFQMNNEIEVLIINRYIHYFLEYPVTAKKVFVWFQDSIAQNSWQGEFLSENGKTVLQEKDKEIAGYVTLTNWHKENILRIYDLDPKKVHVIGNCVDEKNWKGAEKKINNRFIWISSLDRGVEKAIDYFNKINEKHRDAEFLIFGDETKLGDDYSEKIKENKQIKLMGKKTNSEIVKELKKAEYWFYPTFVPETYCISALEAQKAGCICISSDIGGLSETVNGRGVLVSGVIYSKAYEEELLKKVFELMKNRKLKEKYIKKGKEWAEQQVWSKIIKDWMKLLKK